MIDDWTETLDRGGSVDLIYMDFQKAFDKVPHRRLMTKLRSYGITGMIYRWIDAFLTNRTQRVAVNGKFSKWIEVWTGIPQGSVLGPLLFVIFINDLPDAVRSTVFLYADDTKIYREITNKDDSDTLQQDLNTLQKWSDTWLLKFPPKKCKTMSISSRNQDHNMNYNMRDGAEVIELETVLEEKDLGVVTDQHLRFENHIQQKINTANKMMGMIRRTFQHLSIETFRWLFKAMVRPHIEYAQSVWSPQRKIDITVLENVQRRATKMIPGFKDISYPERLKKLDLPTLSYRRIRGDMIEVFKMVHGTYDEDASLQLQIHEGHRTTRGEVHGLFACACR